MTPESALKQVRRDGNTGTTSQKKVEANRRNAQLSTGPTSAEGKETSSLNASKHGLLAKDVVITNRRTKEDQAEFDGLLAEMRDCYRPVGIAEDLLVREMTISYWRSARALRCERGHVTCAIGAPDESELSELEITILTGKSPADAHRSLLESSRGIKFLLSTWEEVNNELRVSSSPRAALPSWLCPEKNWQRIASLGKKHFLAALAKETEELTAKKSQIEEEVSQWRNDQVECSVIPSKDALDRILRYETGNVRHRYKVEARLDQLQARRRENAKADSGKSSDGEISQDRQFCETKPTGSDDGGLGKGPHSVGLAGQTSNDSATPPINTDVPAVELAIIDTICETKPTGDDDGMGKGPHSVGQTGQTSDNSAIPPVKKDVPAVELAVVDADLRNEANK
ncbi:MAG: hypothetical protein ABR881_20790 [Candidatus Sulfotelmatobacter sp.]